jgi:hypothetical protein
MIEVPVGAPGAPPNVGPRAAAYDQPPTVLGFAGRAIALLVVARPGRSGPLQHIPAQRLFEKGHSRANRRSISRIIAR